MSRDQNIYRRHRTVKTKWIFIDFGMDLEYLLIGVVQVCAESIDFHMGDFFYIDNLPSNGTYLENSDGQ